MMISQNNDFNHLHHMLLIMIKTIILMKIQRGLIWIKKLKYKVKTV